MNEMEIELVLPGHRRLITDHKGRIAELKEHHRTRLEEVLSILENSPLSAFEVASQMTWDLDCDSWQDFPRPQKWSATGEAIAHLRYLERKKLILRKDEDGITVFTLNPTSTSGPESG